MEVNGLTLAETGISVKSPGMYAVVMFNDDITTMDFVVDILVKLFHKTVTEAATIMMDIHERGQGIAGVYTFDIAATKKAQADRMAAEKGFPLKLTVREVV